MPLSLREIEQDWPVVVFDKSLFEPPNITKCDNVMSMQELDEIMAQLSDDEPPNPGIAPDILSNDRVEDALNAGLAPLENGLPDDAETLDPLCEKTGSKSSFAIHSDSIESIDMVLDSQGDDFPNSDTLEPQLIALHDWYLMNIGSKNSPAIVLCGLRNVRNLHKVTEYLWKSSMVKERLEHKRVKTINSIYLLVGPSCRLGMLRNGIFDYNTGVPLDVCSAFENGFPLSWDEYIAFIKPASVPRPLPCNRPKATKVCNVAIKQEKYKQVTKPKRKGLILLSDDDDDDDDKDLPAIADMEQLVIYLEEAGKLADKECYAHSDFETASQDTVLPVESKHFVNLSSLLENSIESLQRAGFCIQAANESYEPIYKTRKNLKTLIGFVKQNRNVNMAHFEGLDRACLAWTLSVNDAVELIMDAIDRNYIKCPKYDDQCYITTIEELEMKKIALMLEKSMSRTFTNQVYYAIEQRQSEKLIHALSNQSKMRFKNQDFITSEGLAISIMEAMEPQESFESQRYERK